MRLIFTVLLSVCFISVFAQRAVNKGVITTESGTQSGYIGYSSVQETPQEFEFSENIAGPFSKVQNPVKVEFENGGYYEKKNIIVTILPGDYLNRQKEYYSKVDSLSQFVQLIVKGPVNLYRYVDKYGFPHFFYTDKESQDLKLLVYKPYMRGTVIIDDVAYKNQINSLSRQHCGKEEPVQNLTYTANHLIKQFQRINTCLGGSQNQYEETSKMKFGLEGFLGFSKGRIIGGGFYPSVGVTFTLSPKYNQKSSLFGVDLFITRLSIDGTTNSPGGPYNFSDKIIDISIRPFYRGYLGVNKFQPFFQGGATVMTFSFESRDYNAGTIYGTQKLNSSKIVIVPEFAFGFEFGPAAIQANVNYYLTTSKVFEYGFTGRFRVFN